MRILDLFFPRQCKCIFCGRETKEYGVCEDCNNDLPYITAPTCDICGGRSSGKGKVCIECKGKNFKFDKGYSILEYSGDVKNKIISFKQAGAKHIGETFAYLIEKKFLDIKEDIDIIIPVPISNERLKERGFNQTEVLCENLKSISHVDFKILERIKETPHQTGLSRENRVNNLKGAFRVIDKKAIKGKTVLIVDDIYTTGSTINECADELIRSGAKKVIGLCLARTPINTSKIIK